MKAELLQQQEHLAGQKASRRASGRREAGFVRGTPGRRPGEQEGEKTDEPLADKRGGSCVLLSPPVCCAHRLKRPTQQHPFALKWGKAVAGTPADLEALGSPPAGSHRGNLPTRRCAAVQPARRPELRPVLTFTCAPQERERSDVN